MHTHIAVTDADNKVVAVLRLGLLFLKRLERAISEESGEEVGEIVLPRETPSPELIRFQVQIEVPFPNRNQIFYLAPTWEY